MGEMWYGYDMEMMVFEEKPALVVFPKSGTANGWLAIKTEYWNAFPEAIELEMVKQGFHLCYIKNANRWGLQEDVDRKGRFIRYVTEKYNLNEKVVPVGMSCGGMFAIKMACTYPELMACLYLDAPLIKHLNNKEISASDEELAKDRVVREMLGALSLQSVAQLRAYDQMPIHMLDKLVAARIPAILVLGDADTLVPCEENGLLLKAAYEEAGVPIRTYIKPGCGHNPHGMEDPAPVLRDIMELI